MTGAAEQPPNGSPGVGSAIVAFNLDLMTMRVTASLSGLESSTTQSHIHCCTSTPNTGVTGVAVQTPSLPDFPLGVTSGSYDHTFDMTSIPSYNPAFVVANGGTLASAQNALLAGLNGGMAYVDIHSDLHMGGEIRGFLALVPAAIGVDDGPIFVTNGVARMIPVGANDTNFIGTVGVAVTVLPTKGNITAISAPGPAAGMTITYTANIGAVGADSFVYEMTDITGASGWATVTLDIGPDTDGDGQPDAIDNCTLVANPTQCDSDADGFGNRCDGDMNNNNATNAQDYGLFRNQLGQPSVAPIYNVADMNCNGIVNTQDYGIFRTQLGSPPGPSGLHP